MADFKCKYCGNRLHPEEGQTLITCSRCDETTRIVLTNNVKKKRLLEEADELRFSCLFDRAMQRYETVIQEYPKDADAYWGYVLCIYGVEFQDDARSGKRLPTLHRISSRSILQDPYYQKAIEYANPIDANDYKRIAEELERIRNRFIELSQKEENVYDIFISFKQTDDRYHRETVDCSKAENLYHKLKDMGYRVFFSKVTLANRGGDDYEPIIYTALETSKVMVVIGSSRENLEAPWVRNEWNRFLDMMQTTSGKKLLPVLIEGMAPEMLPDALQSIQGYNIDTQIGMDRLLSRIIQLVPRKTEKAGEAAKGKEFTASEKSLLKRAKQEAGAGNWDKAKEYYNRILDANPECAEAWVGLMLSSDDVQMTELDQYKEHLMHKWQMVRVEEKTVSLSGTGDFINDSVVPNYFTEEDIMDILPDDLKYEAMDESLAENLAEAEEFFASNQYFAYAMKYANETYLKNLKQFQSDILNQIQANLEYAKADSAEKSEQLKREYADQLNEAKEKIEKMHQFALTDRETDYNSGMNVKSGKDVPLAIKKLTKVGNYLDAPQKLKLLTNLQTTNDNIGDGTAYLAQRMIAEKPQAVTNLQNALMHLNAEPDGVIDKIKKWIVLGLYGIIMLAFLFSGDIRTIGCMAIGIAVGVVLWKKKQPYAAYVVYAVMHTIAGTFCSSEWLVIMPVIYIVSFVRRKGYVKSLLARKTEMIVVDEAKDVIKDYEKNLRASIDTIWKNALGISYDGVKLKSILDTLESNNYSLQTGVQPMSANANYITSKVNKAMQKAKTSGLVNVKGQQQIASFDMDDFKEMFGKLWNAGRDDFDD